MTTPPKPPMPDEIYVRIEHDSQGVPYRAFADEYNIDTDCVRYTRADAVATPIEGLDEAIAAVFPIQMVAGDTIHRTNPSSNVQLNSSVSWGVTQEGKSGRKLRTHLEKIEQALRAYQSLTGGK